MMKSMPEQQRRIDQSWPTQALEMVSCCPYCGGADSKLAYESVQDWTFETAPGRWSYWNCSMCSALYLNPRPNRASISQAYARYYTHGAQTLSYARALKVRLINECFSHWHKVDLLPRLSLPGFLAGILKPLRHKLVEPFGFDALVRLPKGKLMDVGCGSGDFLQMARQLGWACVGLELDPAAVHTAREHGLQVEEAAYDRLAHYPEEFDCIICSHVLEHVHAPLDLLEKLHGALKPGGTLLLSAPNSQSKARKFFGVCWRGLEAPRHLSIPSAPFLRNYLIGMGFAVTQRVFSTFPTIAESLTIQKSMSGVVGTDAVGSVRRLLGRPNVDEVDFIEFICVKQDET